MTATQSEQFRTNRPQPPRAILLQPQHKQHNLNPRNHTLQSLRSLLLLLALLALAGTRAAASITIDQVSFHKSFTDMVGGLTSEGGTADNGGVIMVFVRNTGATTESFTANQFAANIGNITLNGTALSLIAGFQWSRPWPLSIGPGQVTTILIKGTASPIAEGQSVSINVTSDQSSVANSGAVTLTTPLLRIGHVVPSRDLGTGSTNLYIFLRNTDTVNPFTVTNVYVDTNVTSQCTFVGGTTVAASSVNIIKVAYPGGNSLPVGRPLAIRLELSNGSTVGAYVRVTEPIFQLGTWAGNDMTWTNRNAQEARGEFNHEVVYPGFNWYDLELPGWVGGAAYHARYGIKGFGQPQNPPNIETFVKPYAISPNFAGYSLYDEPAVQGLTPAQMFTLGMACMTNDPGGRPTMINLNGWRSSQSYGAAVDFPMFDHYCQDAPLQYGGSTTTIGISNSFYFADIMKRNMEPRINYVFSQVAATTWGTTVSATPTYWGVQVQFWNHIMAGMKGVLWYIAKDQNVNTFAATSYAGCKDTEKQFAQIRNLVLYSDSVKDSVTLTSGNNIISRMLVGEKAVVVITAGNNATSKRSTRTKTFGAYNNETITFTVPSWVTIDQVREVTTNGLQSVTYSQVGQVITITGINYTTATPAHVYLVGQNDTTPPLPPSNLNSPQWIGPTNVLCWNQNGDDYGVKGYKVYRDGSEIADVRTPLYRDNPGNSNATYTVKAYDASGNLSAACNPHRQTKPAWTFSNPGDYCGWSEIFEVQQPTSVSGGAYNYKTQTSATSPRLHSPELRIDGAKYTKMRIKFMQSTTGSGFTVFWNTTGKIGFNFDYSKNFNFPPGSSNQWVTMDCDLGTDWTGQVVPIRLVQINLPIGGGSGETVKIESIAFIETQTITFNNPGDQCVAAPITLSATASSGLPVAYTVTAGPATVSGNSLTITGAGSVTVQADQAGDSGYQPAAPVSQTFTVNVKSLAPTSASASVNPICLGGSTVLTLSGGGGGTDETIRWLSGGCGVGAGGTVVGDGNDLSVSPTTTTTYYGRYVQTNSTCGNTDCATVTVTVRADSVVTTWPTASAITYGQTLADSVLSGGAATTAGSFGWTAPSTAPNAGTAAQSVTFTPTDPACYNPAVNSASVTVNQALLSVTATGTLVYGQDPTNAIYVPAYAPFLNGDTAGVLSGAANFSTDATATSYVGPNFIAHVVDTGTLSAANYLFAAGADGVLTVTPAALTVTNVTASDKVYDGSTNATINTAGAGLNGLVNGDEASVSLDSGSATGAFANANVGSGKTVTMTGFTTIGDLGTNYTVSQPTTTASITKADSVVTVWPSASAITYGQTLADSVLSGGAATPAGSFAWTTPGTAPNAGTAPQSVTYTPADLANYNPAVSTASVTVNKAGSTTALVSSQNPSTNGVSVMFTATVSSSAGTPTGNVVFLTNGVALATMLLTGGSASISTADLPVGTIPVDAQYAEQANWLASSNNLNQVVYSAITLSTTNVILSIVDNGGGSYTLNLQGTPGANYYVVASDTITNSMPAWTPVTGSTNTASQIGGLWSFAVSNAAPAFYRVVAEDPAP